MKKKIFRERNNQEIELDVVIHATFLEKIGGIESWVYYVAKKYNIGQITLLYSRADDEQLKRLEPHIRTIQYTDQKIKCNKIIFTMAQHVVRELYENAKEKYLVVHANYGKVYLYGFEDFPYMDKVYAVSDTARDCLKRLTEQEVFTLYNPVEVDKPKKLLKLISATRLTQEKGTDRIQKLSEELDKKGIPYIWLIFTDRPPEKVSKNIILMQPRYNMSDYIVQADYGVQLSDDESYCLFVHECLKLKVPVIVTDLPVYRECNITDKEAHFLKLDMSNLDVEKIYNNIPKVNYKLKDSDKEYQNLLKSGGTKMKKRTFRELYGTENAQNLTDTVQNAEIEEIASKEIEDADMQEEKVEKKKTTRKKKADK